MNCFSIEDLNRLYVEAIIEGYREKFVAIGVKQERERFRQSNIDSAKVMLKAKAPINDITAVTRLRKSVATWSY
jgi:hypothetical protein